MRVPVLACLLVAAACDSGPSNGQPPGDAGIRLQRVVQGLQSPVQVAAPANDARLFVVEQPGRIRVIEGGALRAQPFLDITMASGAHWIMTFGDMGTEGPLASQVMHGQLTTPGGITLMGADAPPINITPARDVHVNHCTAASGA